jgi:phage baseplate assembly protein W
MHVVTDPQARRQIAARAQQALDRHQPRSYRVSVNPDAILEEDGWYTIVVTADNDQRDRDFYDALAEAEAELQDEQGNQYLLVPVLGE